MTGCSSPSYKTEQLLVSDSVLNGVAAAVPSGTLEYNSRGCVSVGDNVVLVAPPGSRLIDDGIVTLAPTAAHGKDRQLQVGEALPSSATGVLVGRQSTFVPTGYDCGSDTFYVLS